MAAAGQALEKDPTIGRVVMGQGRLDKDEMPYEHIEGNLYFGDITEKGGEVNRQDDHYTADTKVGQFVIAERGKEAELKTKLEGVVLEHRKTRAPGLTP